MQEDRSESGRQLGAACAITNLAWQKVCLHAPHLKKFAPHYVSGPLGLPGAAWSPIPRRMKGRTLKFREEKAVAS